ncbi:hypothetical protein [Nonomuraea dietziae]|uniref:hypothetical protein n=1 Tax=Nonomuraea dietziae TaxID=65515 RepID=UPI00341782A5
MTHSSNRELDRAARRYMAEHPGIRYTAARRAVEERARTASASSADSSLPPANSFSASQEALARLLSGRRGSIRGKTSVAFDRALFTAQRGAEGLVLDLDSPGSAPRRQEYPP